MTWNIHGAIGTDGVYSLERVSETIIRNAPDILALQEVDTRRRKTANEPSAFEVLREVVGKHGIEAKSIEAKSIATADGDYGQMLVSRWPFVGSTIHDISHATREPRRAIESLIETPAGIVRIVATHFGLNAAERRMQARQLVAIARQHPATTIMLGDFNDWFWPGSLWAALKSEMPARTRHATFPSKLPLLRLDRIFCWPRSALLHSYVDRQARPASDHLPVIADIVPAAAAAGPTTADTS
jgi:endonuclease/exonuclease/phosphatase family metal-dependent hydrolase